MNLLPISGRISLDLTTPGIFDNISAVSSPTIEPGYVVIYVDNQTIGKDVWFDNVQVLHYNTRVMEENHYYPFGLTVSASALGTTPQPLKYQGIELEKHFGLETYETFFRGLDPQLGRWNSIDPKAELDYGLSPFVSMRNNPVSMLDPIGDEASTHTDEKGKVIAVYNDADLGVYKHEKNADGSSVTKAQIDKRHEVSSSAGGIKMGETHFWDEFRNFNTGNAEGHVIYSNDPRERWNELINWGKVEAKRIGLMNTRTESQLNGDLDIKNNKNWAPYGVMTGRLYNGKFITARSAGNYLAGFNGVTVPLPFFMSVSLGQQYLTRNQYMGLAGAYQQLNTLPKDIAALILLLGVRLPGPYAGEQEYSGRMIQMGIVDGQKSMK